MILSSPWAVTAAIFVLVVSLGLFYSLNKLIRSYDNDAPAGVRTKWQKRMLFAVGFWQFGIAFLLIAMGSWVNSISLFFMGFVMLLLSRYTKVWLP